MRSILASSVLIVSLLIVPSASAYATKGHHPESRHVDLRHSHAEARRVVVPPIVFDDTPSYNDPSKWGGGAP
jgi:hypothetical protein